MIKKYQTDYSGREIKEVECVRETAACVYFVKNVRGIKPRQEERREAKMAEFAQYHDSWDEAHAYLVKKAEGIVKNLQQQLEAANGHLGNIKGMKRPPMQPQGADRKGGC